MSIRYSIKNFYVGLLQVLSKPWMQYFWLFLITLLAAALRFYKLGEWSFWIDEIYTINHASAHFSSLELIIGNIPPARNWFPVSIITTAQILKVLGVSEWSARLASTTIGILTIPILYLPTKRIFGSRVALLALLLLAVSPWHIFWSQNARFYTSLMLFYTLALFAFYFGIEQDKPKYLFLFFILVYLSASERLIAVFIFPVVFLYLVALWILKYERPKGLNLRNLIIISLPAILGIIVELYFLLVRDESRFFGDFNWFTQYQIDDPFRLLLFIGNNIGIPLMVMAIFSSIFLAAKKSRDSLLMIVSALGPLLMLVVLSLIIFSKDRYIFITLYSWIILTVIGITEISVEFKGWRKWLVYGVFFIFFAHAANNLVLYYQANEGNRLPWKSAFAVVREQSNEQDKVVTFWPEFGPYYYGHEIAAYTDVNVDEILSNGNRHWFVLDSETIWTNAPLKTWLENNAELIEVWYLRLPENHYLRVYLFENLQSTILEVYWKT